MYVHGHVYILIHADKHIYTCIHIFIPDDIQPLVRHHDILKHINVYILIHMHT